MKPRPPDLLQLVARFGSYGAIPPSAWLEWDKAVAAYEIARRAEVLRDLSPEPQRKSSRAS